MSSFLKSTVNPDTHEIEMAEWLDNYFGERKYGVRFPSTGIVYREDDYEWTEDNNILATRAVRTLRKIITRVKTELSKTIETREHDDGRKDVTVHVNTLDVEPKDEATAKAKQVIEEQVIPAIADAQILVTVIHKPTNDSASFMCRRKHVRKYAEQVIEQREDKLTDHYCLVQNDGESVTVTTI